MSRDERTAADVGLLILRVGLGGMFLIAHGGPKLLAGPALWGQIGGAMSHLGITFAPVVWGFLAAAAEGLGGGLLLIGLLTRPAAFFMLCTMLVAATMHLTTGEGLQVASHAIEAGVAFLALLIAGAGRYSLDAKSGTIKRRS